MVSSGCSSVGKEKKKKQAAEAYLLHTLGADTNIFHEDLGHMHTDMLVFTFEMFSQNLSETLSRHSTAEVGRCFQQLQIQAIKINKNQLIDVCLQQ